MILTITVTVIKSFEHFNKTIPIYHHIICVIVITKVLSTQESTHTTTPAAPTPTDQLSPKSIISSPFSLAPLSTVTTSAPATLSPTSISTHHSSTVSPSPPLTSRNFTPTILNHPYYVSYTYTMVHVPSEDSSSSLSLSLSLSLPLSLSHSPSFPLFYKVKL